MNKQEIENKLQNIKYPGSSKSIVELQYLKRIDILDDHISLHIDLPSNDIEIKNILKKNITELFKDNQVKINITQPPLQTNQKPPAKNLAPSIKDFVMVSSGKGGVGKSTTTLNLAIALAASGKKVGLLDADIYGPNIPRMMGLEDTKPEQKDQKVIPLEAYGIKMISMGSLIEEGQALIWRGAMIMKVITQLLRDIEWGELDIMVIDMPPGTGDAQLTLAQSVPVSCGICVTTPQQVAIDDTKRSLDMFKKLHIPIAGIVENMSGFLCPDNDKIYDIFGKSNMDSIAKEYETSLLASIPIEIPIREGGDEGKPIMFFAPSSKSAKEYMNIASAIINNLDNKTQLNNAEIQPIPRDKPACS